jgi:hypothetical protein
MLRVTSLPNSQQLQAGEDVATHPRAVVPAVQRPLLVVVAIQLGQLQQVARAVAAVVGRRLWDAPCPRTQQ